MEDTAPEPEHLPQPGVAMPEDLIGSRIALMRGRKGLNHDGLAKLTKLLDQPAQAGISRTTIRGYEVGLYKPGTREIRILSQALEVSPTWLIFGEGLDAPSAGTSEEAGKVHPLGELQKFIVALHLLRSIDASERDTVYNVLHSLARLKHGENAYRAAIIAPAEIGALLSDVWSDLKEYKHVDQDKLQELAKAYGPYFDAIAQKELGASIADIRSKS